MQNGRVITDLTRRFSAERQEPLLLPRLPSKPLSVISVIPKTFISHISDPRGYPHISYLSGPSRPERGTGLFFPPGPLVGSFFRPLLHQTERASLEPPLWL
jgi:hypothetical protein